MEEVMKKHSESCVFSLKEAYLLCNCVAVYFNVAVISSVVANFYSAGRMGAEFSLSAVAEAASGSVSAAASGAIVSSAGRCLSL